MKDDSLLVKKEKFWFWGILLIIFLSRIPFLLPGFGSEEDAWGLYVIAKKVATTGIYEVSRLPGHPFQEFMYLLLWKQGALAFSLLTAAFSTTGIAFFILSLKKLKCENQLTAAIILAFIPVVYINSVNAMDYLWALSCIMMGFYFLLTDFLILSGIFIGLAVGCRITSAAMLLPFVYWMTTPLVTLENGFAFQRKFPVKKILKLLLPCMLVSIALFFPAYRAHGNFFSYVAQVPATFMQAVYRSTIGVWGFIGFTDLITIPLVIFIFRSKNILNEPAEISKNKKLVCFCWMVIVIYLISFIMLPQKAAFFVPMLPFIVILLNNYLNRNAFIAFSFSMIFSSFFIGINLNDNLRGADASRWSFTTKISGQEIAIDFLQGPIIADHIKRRNKMDFAEKVVKHLQSVKPSNKTILISGFWMNDILGKTDSLPVNVRLEYYMNEDSLVKLKQEGYEIYYLPEQDVYNDKCFNKKFTQRIAQPFF